MTEIGAEIGAFFEHDDKGIHPVPVKIIGNENVTSEIPQLAAWSNFQMTTANVGSGAIQVLPQDKRRHRARIYCVGSNAAYVLLGSVGQVQNGRGFILPGCKDVTVESQAAVWASGDGINNTVISVLDERFV